MLTSKVGGSKTLSKVLDILSNASEIKSLIKELSDQESKTKAVINDLVKLETVDDYVKNQHLKLSADVEAHASRVAEFEKEKQVFQTQSQHLNTGIDALDKDRELFESECQSKIASLDEKQLILDDQLSKVADLRSSTEYELENARSLRAEYDSKLKELQDSIARLK